MTRRQGARADSGQATLELLAMLPVVLLLTGLLLQLGAVVWAINDTTEAVRQGARAASQGDGGCAAARRALSGALSDESCGESAGHVEMTVEAPMLVDAFPAYLIRREATMPVMTD